MKKSPITAYTATSALTASHLADKVNELLAAGWQLRGAVVIARDNGTTVHAQALVKRAALLLLLAAATLAGCRSAQIRPEAHDYSQEQATPR